MWGVSACSFNLGLFDGEGVCDCLCLCIFHIFVQIRTLYGRLIILHMFGIGVLGGVGIPHVCVWLGLDSFCLVGLRC